MKSQMQRALLIGVVGSFMGFVLDGGLESGHAKVLVGAAAVV